MVGGPDFHPVNAQAARIMDWLGPNYACHTAESLAAFEHLVECDLLVLMGQHWTGWEGRYRSPSDVHRRNFEKYVQSGRPILASHGAIASYNDWPRFGELIGFSTDWEKGSHSPVADQFINITDPDHPLTAGVGDFRIIDELIDDIQLTESNRVEVHAIATWMNRQVPILMSQQGGRILGAGKSAYIGLGHDMRAMESPQLKQLWLNAVNWLMIDGE